MKKVSNFKATNVKEIKYAYAELDLALICEEPYNELKPIDILVFTLLKNQESLSVESLKAGNYNYVDEDGNIFVKISQLKLSKVLNINPKTLKSSLDRLVDVGLLYIERVGNQECNKMYVGQPVRTITLGDYMKTIGLEVEKENKEKKEKELKRKEAKQEKESKLEKISNKKVASSPQTNNSQLKTKSLKNDLTKNSISDCKDIVNKNLNTIIDSGIKYVSKRDHDYIEKMDRNVLLVAVQLTKENSSTMSFKYLKEVYESNLRKVNNSSNSIPAPQKTSFHNFEETFTKYTTEELDRMIEESQKEKFK